MQDDGRRRAPRRLRADEAVSRGRGHCSAKRSRCTSTARTTASSGWLMTTVYPRRAFPPPTPSRRKPAASSPPCATSGSSPTAAAAASARRCSRRSTAAWTSSTSRASKHRSRTTPPCAPSSPPAATRTSAARRSSRPAADARTARQTPASMTSASRPRAARSSASASVAADGAPRHDDRRLHRTAGRIEQRARIDVPRKVAHEPLAARPQLRIGRNEVDHPVPVRLPKPNHRARGDRIQHDLLRGSRPACASTPESAPPRSPQRSPTSASRASAPPGALTIPTVRAPRSRAAANAARTNGAPPLAEIPITTSFAPTSCTTSAPASASSSAPSTARRSAPSPAGNPPFDERRIDAERRRQLRTHRAPQAARSSPHRRARRAHPARSPRRRASSRAQCRPQPQAPHRRQRDATRPARAQAPHRRADRYRPSPDRATRSRADRSTRQPFREPQRTTHRLVAALDDRDAGNVAVQARLEQKRQQAVLTKQTAGERDPRRSLEQLHRPQRRLDEIAELLRRLLHDLGGSPIPFPGKRDDAGRKRGDLRRIGRTIVQARKYTARDRARRATRATRSVVSSRFARPSSTRPYSFTACIPIQNADPSSPARYPSPPTRCDCSPCSAYAVDPVPAINTAPSPSGIAARNATAASSPTTTCAPRNAISISSRNSSATRLRPAPAAPT